MTDDTGRLNADYDDMRARAWAAEAKLVDAVLAVRHCEDSNWRLTQRVLPAEAKLAAIQARLNEGGDLLGFVDDVSSILDGEAP